MNQAQAKFFFKLKRVLFITLGWMLAGVALATYEHLITGYDLYIRTAEYSFTRHVAVALIGGLIAGLTGGSLMVFYLRDRFRRLSLGYSIFLHTVTFLCLIFVFSIVATLIYQMIQYKTFFTDERVLAGVKHFLTGQGLPVILGTWLVISFFTIFLLEVSDKYGPGVLWDFITGKYHRPKEEMRIFMFLDLKSSTTIAEKLGNEKYYQLLNDFYHDITDAIIYSKGEIYQYVGDEVVISWKMESGLEDANCIRCFFEIQKSVEALSERYRERYGVVPEFKAGLHAGLVTIGEIGVVKKDLIFTGDVLNTTSRIQYTCNEYGRKILLSKNLADKIDVAGDYVVTEIGEIQLRGKQEKVFLNTVDRA